MTVVRPSVRLVGALGAPPSVRERVRGLAPVVFEEDGLILAGTQGTRLRAPDDLVVVACGRPASDEGRDRAEAILVQAARDAMDGRPIDDLVRPVWGLWSVVAFDRRTRRLLLLAHPMGERTVHRVRVGGGAWMFGDEIRDVLDIMDRTPPVDPGSVAAWATSWSFHGERTVFSGVKRLLAGTHCLITGTSDRVSRWYQPRLPLESDMIDDFHEAVELTRSEVDAAVLRATDGRAGQVAMALSGGVDSSMLVSSLSTSVGAERILALSNVFPAYRSADEQDLIEQTVAHLGVRSERFERAAPALLPAWKQWTRSWKVPVSTPMVAITHPLRLHAASIGVDELLTGEGGDELFVNWPAPWISDLVRRGRLVRAWRAAGELPYAGRGPRSRLRSLREPVAALLPKRTARLLYEAPFMDLSLVRPEFREEVRSAEEASRREEGVTGPYWWRGRLGAIGGFRRTADVDGSIRRAARLAGIEELHPLMHDRAVNEALPRIRPALHFDHRIDRIVARNVLAERLPAAVAWQPGKRHFSDLLTDSMTGPERAELIALVRTSSRLQEFFDGARLAALTADDAEARHRGGVRGWMVDIFKLVSVELWLRELAG